MWASPSPNKKWPGLIATRAEDNKMQRIQIWDELGIQISTQRPKCVKHRVHLSQSRRRTRILDRIGLLNLFTAHNCRGASKSSHTLVKVCKSREEEVHHGLYCLCCLFLSVVLGSLCCCHGDWLIPPAGSIFKINCLKREQIAESVFCHPLLPRSVHQLLCLLHRNSFRLTNGEISTWLADKRWFVTRTR